jgi:hypothetical protein
MYGIEGEKSIEGQVKLHLYTSPLKTVTTALRLARPSSTSLAIMQSQLTNLLISMPSNQPYATLVR